MNVESFRIIRKGFPFIVSLIFLVLVSVFLSVRSIVPSSTYLLAAAALCHILSLCSFFVVSYRPKVTFGVYWFMTLFFTLFIAMALLTGTVFVEWFSSIENTVQLSCMVITIICCGFVLFTLTFYYALRALSELGYEPASILFSYIFKL